MTEAEWMACTDPDQMRLSLRRSASKRKLRLFACACVRRIWHLLPDDRCRRAVEVGESYADGTADENELRSASAALEDVLTGLLDREMEGGPAVSDAVSSAIQAAKNLLATRLVYAARTPSRFEEDAAAMAYLAVPDKPGRRKERDGQIALLRDIFANPFRPVALNPDWLSWRGGLLVSMARRMYDSRDFSELPVLANALEEAGCTDPDILNHSRLPGEHVRGCWVIDLMLGKS